MNTDRQSAARSREESRRHERSDLQPAMIAGVLAVLIFSLAMILWALLLAYKLFTGQSAVDSKHSSLGDLELINGRFQTNVPPPRLQFNPQNDFEQWQARQEEEINSYGWVDRKSGIVRIPIERAMSLFLERQPADRE